MEHICKFCGKEFDSGHKLGGHVSCCKDNPNRLQYSFSGKKLSQNHKDAIKKGMKIAVKEGRQKTPKPGGICKSFTVNNIKDEPQYIQGSWEKKFVEFLNENKINWSRNNTGFRYQFNNDTKTYFPDFYLEDYDVFVEVKGYQTEKDIAKWQNFPKKLLIVKKEELKNLEIWVQSLSGISTGLISRG